LEHIAPDMREVDDLSLRRSSIFVDSYDTTLEHIGELKIPLNQKVISKQIFWQISIK
jgi:ornithine cyclodeaminase